jgi:hypothetical protein
MGVLVISINPPYGRSSSRIMPKAPAAGNEQTNKTMMTVAFWDTWCDSAVDAVCPSFMAG